LFLTGLYIFPAFLYPISIGILQGTKRFNAWGWNYILICFLKLIISIILVLLSFNVYGPLIGFFIAGVVGFFLVFPFIKDILSTKEIKEKINIFSDQSMSTFFAILIVVLIYSIDVIIVKILFNSEIAGKYAVASLIGKMILFSTSAIGSAMFPISSEKFEKGFKSRGVIKKTFLSVMLICSIAIILLFLIPEFILKILLLTQYLSISNILVYIAIAFSSISLLNILVLYKLSVERFKPKHVFILLFFLILQVGVMLYTGDDIVNFSVGFMFSSIISFIGSLILLRK
jgi:O-antigen/teichoic acid export membrane protein